MDENLKKNNNARKNSRDNYKFEQYYKNNRLNYFVNIGETLDYTGADISTATSIASEIKTHMATLRWEIWEKHGQCSRKDMVSDWETGYEEFIESIMKDSENGYTIEEIEKTDGVDSVISINLFNKYGITSDILPSKVKNMLETDKYKLLLVNSNYEKS